MVVPIRLRRRVEEEEEGAVMVAEAHHLTMPADAHRRHHLLHRRVLSAATWAEVQRNRRAAEQTGLYSGLISPEIETATAHATEPRVVT